MGTDSKDKNYKSLAGIGVGGLLIDDGIQKLTGQERLYHGTHQDSWKYIKDEGLRNDLGGHGGAASVADNDAFRRASKGYVHVTKDRSMANTYARINHVADFKNIRPIDVLAKGLFGPGEGKRVTMYMNYDKWDKNFVNDTHAGATTMADRGRAAKGNVSVNPDEIVGSSAPLKDKFLRAARYFPEYARNHPKRMLGGAGMVLGGGALAVTGATRLYNSFNKKEASQNLVSRTVELIEKSACFF